MSHKITQFGKWAGVLLLAATLGGCGNKTASPASSPRASAPARVSVLSWKDYFSPEVCEQFTKDTGIEIDWRYYENLEEMNALLRSESGAFDVVVLDDMSLAELQELQILHPLDLARVPHFPNIDPRWINLAFDRGNKYSVPFMWGTTLVAYRKDKITDPVKSWALLWDEKLRGHLLMLTEKSDVYAVTMLSLGLRFSDKTDANLDRCTAKLKQQVESVDVRYMDIYAAKEALLKGDCWAFLAYSGDAAGLVEKDENIAYFIPKEGAPLWLDSFAMPREAPHTEAGYRFIDYMTEAKAAAGNANFLSYATANRAALPFLNPDLLANPEINPPEEVLSRCAFIPTGSFDDEVTNRGMKEILDLIQRRDLARDHKAEPPATGKASATTNPGSEAEPPQPPALGAPGAI